MKPGIKDVAKVAGVSPTTVSRVLNNRGYISEETRKKVYDAMEEINYYPNEIARALLNNRTYFVGVIVPTVTSPFHGEVVEQIEYYLSQKNYKMLLCNSKNQMDTEKAYIDMLRRNQVDGMIVGTHNAVVETYSKLKMPVVGIDRYLGEHIPVVSCDNYAAVTMASVLHNTKSPRKIFFFLIDDEIKPENKLKITKTVENMHGNIEFVKIKNNDLNNCYVSGELSRASYFRLDISNILSEKIKKIIYLDCDLLVYADIAELWALDMQEKPLAAACDLGIMASGRLRDQKNNYIGLAYDAPYFNAGVLVMDLQLWRLGNYAVDVIALASDNKFPNHDQDALNKFFMNKWQEIPLKWNVIPPVFNLFVKILLKNELRKKAIEAKLNPAIFHPQLTPSTK